MGRDFVVRFLEGSDSRGTRKGAGESVPTPGTLEDHMGPRPADICERPGGSQSPAG